MFISVPRKGRNAGWALKDVFGGSNYFDPDYIADFLNGRAKQQAKRQAWSQEFREEFEQRGWQEITRKADTGRKSPRAVLDEIQVPSPGGNTVVSGGILEKELLESSEPDEIYVADDQAANRLLQGKEVDYRPETQDLNSLLEENISGYEPVADVGETVSVSAMWSEESSPGNVQKVLLLEDLYALSEEVADSYWGQDLDKASYREFAESNGFQDSWDEEQLLSEAGEDVGGVYITNSGGTADDYNLDYDEVVDSTVRRWNSVENSTRGVSI
ncbi:MAG: hypothetical protein ABEJ87_01515 [Candidatus Nanohalobium sp.]